MITPGIICEGGRYRIMGAPFDPELYTNTSPCQQGPHFTGKTGKLTKENPCQGKHRECGKFAETQGIWFAQVKNSLILKVKDISMFAAKIPKSFFEAGYVCRVIFIYVIATNHVNCHRENLRSDWEKTQNLKIQFEWVP